MPVPRISPWRACSPWLRPARSGLSLPAATLGAAGFMLDTAFLAERVHPSYLFGLAWIPGVFLLAGRAVAAPRAWTGVLLGVVVALQVLTYPQLACFVGYALLLLLLARLLIVRPRPPYPRRLAVTAVAAIATAELLSAAQWVPTLELVAQAGRGTGGLRSTRSWDLRHPTGMPSSCR
jgi:hypothetical protein